MDTPENRLLPLKEVARILATSVRQVWRLIAAGELPQPVKVGRSARLFFSDVVSYLDRLKIQRGEKI